MNRSTRVARRTVRARRIIWLLSTVVASAAVQPAFAQLAPPAPVRPSVDANGVDLFSGTMTAKGTPMVLGQTGGNGLSYYKVNTGTGWTDNTIASLNQSGNVVTVALGGYSDSFNVSGSTFTPTEGNGATLTRSSNVFTYTRSDGTVIHFDFTRAAGYPYYANNGRVTDITSPSGLKLAFSYYGINYCSSSKPSKSGTICTIHSNAFRVTTVASSAGYSLSFSYGELDPYDPNDTDNGPNFTEFSTVLGVSSSNTVTGGTGPSESFSASTDGNGYNVLTISDPAGRSTLYRSNAYGIAAVQLPTSSSDDITVAYGSNGRVSGVTTSIGTTTYGSLDTSDNRTITVTDPASNVTTYVFSIASQRMTTVTDALGHVASSNYDTSGRITQVVRPEGDGLSYTYDANGNITATTANAKNNGGSQAVSSASYPCSSSVTCNEPQWTRDALGNQTDYAYDATTGEVTSVTHPAAANGTRPQARYTYTSVGGVSLPTSISQCQTAASCSGTADEVRTTIAYNSNLLPTSVGTGAGDGSLTATSAYSYDAVGNLISVDGPLSGSADTTTYSYDADREVVQTISPDPDGGGPMKQRSATIAYLGTGQVSTKTIGTVDGSGTFTALQQVSSSYDANHRKVQDTIIAGGTTYSVTQYAYDNLGRLQCTAQRMNPSAFGSLPGACSPGTAGSYGNDWIAYTHYDVLGRPDYATSAYQTNDAATEHVSYTTNGKTATVTDANGNVTTYSYDGYDRAVTTTYTDGSYEQLAYDANGNITSRRLRDGQSIGYNYDALGRLVARDVPNSVYWETDKSYGYDLLGHLTSAADSNGRSLGFSYDALGRKVNQSDSWYAFGNASFLYDVAGRRTRTTWNDGFWVGYGYLTTGETNVVSDGGGNTLVAYAYDDLGRRTSLTRANGTITSYAFDAASKLMSLTHDLSGTAQDLTLTFAYTPAGQISSRTSSNDAYAFTQSYNVDRAYTVNGLNQLTSAGATTFGYDGRGNLNSSGATAYTYTSENRMAVGAGVGLAYDPLDRLFNLTEAGVNTTLTYDGANAIAEVDQNNGALLRRYVQGPGSDEPLIWYEGSGTSDRRWLHADERGSVIAVTNDAGAAIAINTYDEYGIPGSGNIGRFQYTGQKWLPSVGMYDYKARMYSPTLGRFMQTDPVGYGDGLNWYNYVGGDPINMVDPTGLKAKEPPKITFKCNSSGLCTWTSSDGSSGTYNSNTGDATINGFSGTFNANDVVVTGNASNVASSPFLMPLSSVNPHVDKVGPLPTHDQSVTMAKEKLKVAEANDEDAKNNLCRAAVGDALRGSVPYTLGVGAIGSLAARAGGESFGGPVALFGGFDLSSGAAALQAFLTSKECKK